MANVGRKMIESGGVKVGQAILGVVTTLWLARWLGAEDFGRYAFALTIGTLLSVVAQLGWPTLLTREIARSRIAGQWSKVRGVIRYSNRMVFGLSFFFAAVPILIGIAKISGADPRAGAAFIACGVFVPLAAFAGLRSAALRGLERVLSGQLLDAIVRPVFFLAITLAAATSLHLSAAAAMWAQAAATLVSLLFGAWILSRALPTDLPDKEPVYDSQAWLSSLLPLAFVSGAQIFSAQIDVIVLGLMSEPDAVGRYKIAVTIAAQVAFATWMVNAVFAPHIVRLHMSGEHEPLRMLVRKGGRYSLLIAVPVLAVILLLGQNGIVRFLGEDFRSAYVPMVILAVGQLLAVSAGPVGLLLGMTGNERYVARAVGVSVVVSLVLNIILINFYGTTGAAVATATALVVSRLLLFHYARKYVPAYARTSQ